MSSPVHARSSHPIYQGRRPCQKGALVGLSTARQRLSQFVTHRAQQTANELGFGWIGTPHAPSTYQQLRGAFALSVATGAPLPISNLYCNTTIYVSEADNMRFRFWHDASHMKLGLSFRLDDEWELACWHLDQARRAGFSSASLEYRLLRGDVLGQIIIQALAQRFPSDQKAFVVNCVEQGLDVGILDELRRFR